MSKLTLFSPAKINLTLKVVGRRKDGYHDLETLMQTIDLGDTLTFKLTKSDALTCDDSSLACDSSNFIWQAIRLFRVKTKLDFAVHIDLKKRIFIGRGLGGGSSNIATTLYGLNQLLGAEVPEEDLQKWSSELSSDAPFFFSQGTAFCTSRGEVVQNRSPLPKRELYLINPQYGLSTKHVFEEFDRQNFSGSLEAAAFSIEPRLRELKNDLQKRFQTVFMTGSGSALICENGQKEGLPIHFIQRENGWYPTIS